MPASVIIFSLSHWSFAAALIETQAQAAARILAHKKVLMMAVVMAAAMAVMMMMAVMMRMPLLVVVVVIALSDASGQTAGAKLPRPPAQTPSPR